MPRATRLPGRLTTVAALRQITDVGVARRRDTRPRRKIVRRLRGEKAETRVLRLCFGAISWRERLQDCCAEPAYLLHFQSTSPRAAARMARLRAFYGVKMFRCAAEISRRGLMHPRHALFTRHKPKNSTEGRRQIGARPDSILGWPL